MKSIRLFLPVIAFVLLSTGVVLARMVRPWSYQELLDKSDLAVIATPTVTNDTKEHGDHPERAGQPVIGVETGFTVSVVLKGDKTLKDFILHHYRADKMQVPNAPTFFAFDPAEKRTYILFLVREADGRYAPVVGQTDPGLAVKELR